MTRILLINDFEKEGGAEVVMKSQGAILESKYHVDYYYGSAVKMLPPSPFDYIYSFKQKKKLYNQIRDNDYSAIHIHNYYHLLTPSILSSIKKLKRRGLRCKVIYTAHDYHLLCPSPTLTYFKNHRIIKFETTPSIWSLLFKKIDYRSFIFGMLKKFQWILAYKILNLQGAIDIIVSPSNFLKEKFAPALKQEIVVIRNPVNHVRKELSVKDAAHAKQLHLVYLGRIVFDKGIYEFIKALAHIDEAIDLTFTIIGEGEFKPNIQALINRLNLQTKVCIKDAQSHASLMQELNNYHCLVLPSLMYENAPLSVVEASMSGLKLMVSDYGGIKEMAEACGGGYYFEPYQPASIQAAIQCAWNDLNAPRHAGSPDRMEEFDINTCKAQLLGLYENII